MNSTLKQAYRIIFGANPDPKMEDWEIAKEVISPERFDKEELGIALAREVILTIALDPIKFPDRTTEIEIVGEAEYQAKAKNMWPNLPNEVHVADLDRIRYSEGLEQKRKAEGKLIPR